MKKEELRIGNYVRVPNEKPQVNKVDSILDIGINFDYQSCCGGGSLEETPVVENLWSYDNIEGILISEEWLMKLGFENKGKFENKIALPGNPPHDMDGSMCFMLPEYKATIYLSDGNFHYELDSHVDDYGTTIFTREIEFVHQLQNLIYALSGEELTIQTAP